MVRIHTDANRTTYHGADTASYELNSDGLAFAGAVSPTKLGAVVRALSLTFQLALGDGYFHAFASTFEQPVGASQYRDADAG